MDFPSHAHIDDYVRRLLAEGQYRPTVVAIVFRQQLVARTSSERLYLLVQEHPQPQTEPQPHGAGPIIWQCPQGGIEPADCEQPGILQTAFQRELHEELSLEFPEHLRMIEPCLHNEFLEEPNRRQNRGFSRGKHYFCGLIQSLSNTPVYPSQDLLSCGWLTFSEAIAHFAGLRQTKARLLAYVLDKSEKYLFHQEPRH